VHRFRNGFPWFASGLISVNTFGSEVDFLPNVDKIWESQIASKVAS